MLLWYSFGWSWEFDDVLTDCCEREGAIDGRVKTVRKGL